MPVLCQTVHIQNHGIVHFLRVTVCLPPTNKTDATISSKFESTSTLPSVFSTKQEILDFFKFKTSTLLMKINCLPNNKISDWFKLKALADDKTNATQKLKFAFG